MRQEIDGFEVRYLQLPPCSHFLGWEKDGSQNGGSLPSPSLHFLRQGTNGPWATCLWYDACRALWASSFPPGLLVTATFRLCSPPLMAPFLLEIHHIVSLQASTLWKQNLFKGQEMRFCSAVLVSKFKGDELESPLLCHCGFHNSSRF